MKGHAHNYQFTPLGDNVGCRACLDQLLIAIRSLIILCDHIRSKTRLIAIMNLIATLVIIYTSLHNRRLSEYQLSLLLLLPTNRTRGEGEDEE